MACKGCGSTAYREFTAREMMFGTRARFAYRECLDCASLQIGTVPDDIEAYYPSGYYSFEPATVAARLGLLSRRILHEARRGGIVSVVLRRLSERRAADSILGVWAGEPGSRVLDVGCGSGALVDRLARSGYPEPVGIDPFIQDDLKHPSGAVVLKASLPQLAGRQFDTVMFHHALEHVPDPAMELERAASLLRPGGRCVVRIPTTSSDAYERYGPDWVQLDPPRHLFIPSRKAMVELGSRSGLRIVQIIDDSQGFQFWGSEQYRRDIPAMLPGLGMVPHAVFKASEITAWETEAEQLNAAGRGDQAAFIFEKTD